MPAPGYRAEVAIDGEPELSVVIPTYRRPDLLARCLASLKAQDCARERFEVVVVDDGSGDHTPEVLADAAATDEIHLVPLLQAKNAGPAAARNRGVTAARGRLILFLDDDVVATPDLVSRHIALHETAQDVSLGVLGRVDWHPDLSVTRFMRWIDASGLQFAYDTWLREGRVDPPYAAFYTANLSMHRELVQRVGGFDERFPYAAFEDIELAYRLAGAGFHLDYRPGARAFHARPMDLAGFCDRMAKVGQSAELIRQAAPAFPLDDADLRNHATRRRQVLRLALRAAVQPSDETRSRYYWARVATAYDRGRARARSAP